MPNADVVDSVKVLFGVGSDDSGNRWCVMVRVGDTEIRGPEEYPTRADAERAAADVSALAKFIIFQIEGGAALFLPVEREN